MTECDIISDLEAGQSILWLSSKLAKEGFDSLETRVIADFLEDKFLAEAGTVVGLEGVDFIKKNKDGSAVTVGCAFSCWGARVSHFYVAHLAVDADNKPLSSPVVIPFKEFEGAINHTRIVEFFETKIRESLSKTKGKGAAHYKKCQPV